jgi:hypothetical protein
MTQLPLFFLMLIDDIVEVVARIIGRRSSGRQKENLGTTITTNTHCARQGLSPDNALELGHLLSSSSLLIMYKSPSYCSPRLIAKVARAEPWNSSVRRFTSSLVLPVPSDLWKSFPCFFLWHPQLLVKFSICIPRLQHSTSGYRERRGVIKLFILSENRKLLL